MYVRIEVADGFYDASGEERCGMLPVYTDELGTTPFLLPMNLNLKCEGIKKIYQNEAYQIFEAAGE